MGQTIVQRHVLIIANEKLQQTQELLTSLYLQAQKCKNYYCYSLTQMESGKTTIINPRNKQQLNTIQLVFVVGQNCELLRAFSLFQSQDSPPIFGISSTKDFTIPPIYNYSFFHVEITTALVFQEPEIQALHCDRLMKLSLGINCDKVGEATCQVEIHRGVNQSILVINIYIEESCEHQKIKIGQFKGDGLLISTPYGSYCKNLSLNGPLMDRTMQNILITPICPLSMKFRPLCLPSKTKICLQLDQTCRTQKAQIYIDQDSNYVMLKKGQLLNIHMSKHKSKMVANLIQSSEQMFIRSLKSVLGWGQTYEHINLRKLPRRLSTIQQQYGSSLNIQ